MNNKVEIQYLESRLYKHIKSVFMLAATTKLWQTLEGGKTRVKFRPITSRSRYQSAVVGWNGFESIRKEISGKLTSGKAQRFQLR